MKFEDVKVGQRLQDPYGNVYLVLDIQSEPKFMVKLKCITFRYAVKVEYDFTFNNKGHSWWVHADRNRLLDLESPTTQQILQCLGVPKHKFETIEGFSVTYIETTKIFRPVASKCIAGIEVTIADMKLLPEPIKEEAPTELTPDDIKIGAEFQDTRGNKYIVVAKSDAAATLYCNHAESPTVYYGDTYNVAFGKRHTVLSIHELSALED